MKLKNLKSVLYSNRGNIQFSILYESKSNTDIATGAIEYIIENYGEKTVKHIEAFENQILITV